MSPEIQKYIQYSILGLDCRNVSLGEDVIISFNVQNLLSINKTITFAPIVRNPEYSLAIIMTEQFYPLENKVITYTYSPYLIGEHSITLGNQTRFLDVTE